jgi:predicted choloylglycine hydrolase
MNIVFEAIAEDRPGPKWRAIYDRHWHAYSRWFMRDGLKARPTYLASLRAIRQHMPELVPAYEAVSEAAGGGDLEARFLSMWCPPMYVGGCSQAIMLGSEPAIIRNYDYSPKLLEGTWLASRLSGKRVLGMVDCLWGVLDGINEDGLAASLAFGGRTAVAEGFGIPIVMRYVLEFAATVAEAVKILDRVPVHMSYTISLLDRKGRHATVFVAPDRPTEVLDQRIATNHQHEVEWTRHATATRSVERAQSLDQALVDAPQTEAMLKAFLRPPVYQTAYGRGYGTLYTAVYRPGDASAELVWPAARWRQSCAHFAEEARTIRFAEGNASGRLRPAKGISIRGGIL